MIEKQLTREPTIGAKYTVGADGATSCDFCPLWNQTSWFPAITDLLALAGGISQVPELCKAALRKQLSSIKFLRLLSPMFSCTKTRAGTKWTCDPHIVVCPHGELVHALACSDLAPPVPSPALSAAGTDDLGLDGDDIRSRFPWYSADTLSPFSAGSHVSLRSSEQSPDPETACAYEATPLALAVLAGNVRAIAAILDRMRREGTLARDLAATDSRGRTPLVACIFGVDALEITADNVPLVSQTHPYHVAIFRLLVDATPDPAEFERPHACIHGISPFILAAYLGKHDYVRRMLERGAAVDAPDAQNGTALMYAARDAHVAVVRTLLEYGAAPDRVDGDGWSAIDYAAKYPHVRELLEAAPRFDLEEDLANQHAAETIDDADRRNSYLDAVRHAESGVAARGLSPLPLHIHELHVPPHHQNRSSLPPPPALPVHPHSHASAPSSSTPGSAHAPLGDIPTPATSPAGPPSSAGSDSEEGEEEETNPVVERIYAEYCKVAEHANALRAAEAAWIDRWYSLARCVIDSVSPSPQTLPASPPNDDGAPDAHLLESLTAAVAHTARAAHAAHASAAALRPAPPASPTPSEDERHVHAADALAAALAELLRAAATQRAAVDAAVAARDRADARKLRDEAEAASKDARQIADELAALKAQAAAESVRGGEAAVVERVRGIAQLLPPPPPPAASVADEDDGGADLAKEPEPESLASAFATLESRARYAGSALRALREQNVRLIRELDQKDVAQRLLEHQVNWLKINHETVTAQQSQCLTLQAHTIQSLATANGGVGAGAVGGGKKEVEQQQQQQQQQQAGAASATSVAAANMADVLRLAESVEPLDRVVGRDRAATEPNPRQQYHAPPPPHPSDRSRRSGGRRHRPPHDPTQSPSVDSSDYDDDSDDQYADARRVSAATNSSSSSSADLRIEGDGAAAIAASWMDPRGTAKWAPPPPTSSRRRSGGGGGRRRVDEDGVEYASHDDDEYSDAGAGANDEDHVAAAAEGGSSRYTRQVPPPSRRPPVLRHAASHGNFGQRSRRLDAHARRPSLPTDLDEYSGEDGDEYASSYSSSGESSSVPDSMRYHHHHARHRTHHHANDDAATFFPHQPQGIRFAAGSTPTQRRRARTEHGHPQHAQHQFPVADVHSLRRTRATPATAAVAASIASSASGSVYNGIHPRYVLAPGTTTYAAGHGPPPGLLSGGGGGDTLGRGTEYATLPLPPAPPGARNVVQRYATEPWFATAAGQQQPTAQQQQQGGGFVGSRQYTAASASAASLVVQAMPQRANPPPQPAARSRAGSEAASVAASSQRELERERERERERETRSISGRFTSSIVKRVRKMRSSNDARR
ncbi:hypothetical protein H9P43_006716 [Blastocladiella emersonii ATCC 22665]|nr:hypothetical protein H9P43_006716 [Blastocladiella emersonii ATCC 22665]